MLSQIPGQVIHALLTRAPLSSEQAPILVRLACVKHAASVRSEPGSNSPVYFVNGKSDSNFFNSCKSFRTHNSFIYYLVFKDQVACDRFSTLTEHPNLVNNFFSIFFLLLLGSAFSPFEEVQLYTLSSFSCQPFFSSTSFFSFLPVRPVQQDGLYIKSLL